MSIFKKKKTEAAAVATTETSPYLAAQQQWDLAYGATVQQARTMSRLALFAGLAALASFVGLVYVSGQQQQVPYVVAVDKFQTPVAVSAQQQGSMPAAVVRASVAEYIRLLRGVSLDYGVQKQWLSKAYTYMTAPSARGFLDAYYHGDNEVNNPFKIAEDGYSVTVEVTSAVPLTGNSWQVDWTEVKRDRNGSGAVSKNYRAILGVKVAPPQTRDEVSQNPLGLTVHSIQWSSINSLETKQ